MLSAPRLASSASSLLLTSTCCFPRFKLLSSLPTVHLAGCPPLRAAPQVLNQVQERFDVDIKELPDKIDCTTYMTAA